MKKLLRHVGVIGFLFGTSHRFVDFVSLGLFLRVTRFRNYEIVKRKIEYNSTHVIYNKNIKEFPECVGKYKHTIKYFYNGSFYNYVTFNRTPDIEDIKKNNNDARLIFRIPLYSCHLIEGSKTRNVTKTLIKYLGPRGDCHGLSLTPVDIFGGGDYIVVFKSMLGTTVIKNYESIPQF